MAVMELSPSATLLLTEGKKATAMATVMSKKHDEQAGLALGLHGLYTSLLLKYHKGPGAGSGPLRENYCSTI